MKKIIAFISLFFISLACFAQEPAKTPSYMNPEDHPLRITTGPVKISRLFIDNMDLRGAHIPSFQDGKTILKLLGRKIDDHFTVAGDSLHVYYTSPYIYEVDGVLLVSEEDKKKLANLDIWDTTYFEVLKPREAKKRFGKVGKKGAVIIKTAKGNYIDTE